MYGGRTYEFYLNIGPDELMRVYTGSARRLRVTTVTGLTLELDAQHLRRFTTRAGIRGRFRLTVGEDNRFLSLERTDG